MLLLQNLILQVSVAKNVSFLYGGSVSSQTKTQFDDIDIIEGFLIGKASIDFQEFKKIVDWYKLDNIYFDRCKDDSLWYCFHY